MAYRYISNGDAFTDDCTIITNWDNIDVANGVSTQTTFDGRSAFKFDTNSPAVGNRAGRAIDIGSVDNIGNIITVTMSVYFESLGSTADIDYFQLAIYRSDLAVFINFGNNGVFIFDGSTMNPLGNLVNIGEWQEWSFKIDISSGIANAVCDAYLNGVQVGSQVDCSYVVSIQDGLLRIYQNGRTSSDLIAYVDKILVGSDYVRGYAGTSNDSARVIAIRESDWSITNNELIGVGNYNFALDDGSHLIIARRETDGEIVAYGNVDPL